MSMTANRKKGYKRSWFNREIKIDMRNRRKEYNRKVRYAKITENSSPKEYKQLMKLCWNTMS